jgi:DNA-binding MarR family transcriptional regulator
MSDAPHEVADHGENGTGTGADEQILSPDTLAESLNDMLYLVVRRLRQQTARKAALYGLAPAQYVVFQTIAFNWPRRMGEIVDLTDYPASSLTSIVDRLTALDLVTRSPHPTDRRAIQVRLTPQGEELARRMADDRRNDQALLLQDFDQEELVNFAALMRQFLAGLDRLDAKLTAQGIAEPRHGHEPHPEIALPR